MQSSLSGFTLVEVARRMRAPTFLRCGHQVGHFVYVPSSNERPSMELTAFY